MNNTEYTKEQINEAIYTVLTTQFKKDAKEEHKIVESAGYTIKKYDGSFEVSNKKNHRYVQIGISKYYWYKGTIYHGPYRCMKCSVDLRNKVFFDFVGCLEKPINSTWYELLDTQDRSQLLAKYERLHSAKWHIEYDENEIKNIKKKIDTLQNELIYYAKSLARANENLATVRKELGLA